MLQIIGFIVAVYAICRLAQVAFELTNSNGDRLWNGLPFSTRFIVVASISGVGILILGALSMCLLFHGAGPGPQF
jgi:hypothetical protein